MQIDFNLWVIAIGSLIVVGLSAATLLWFRRERFLSLLILTISLWLIHTFYSVSGIFQQNADYYFRPIYYSLAFGPLIYFYTKSLTNRNFKFRRLDLLHFLPVLLQAGLYLFLFLQTYSFKNDYWHNWHQPLTYRIEFVGTFISLALYTVLSLFLLRNYQIWLKDNFSEPSKITLNWLRLVLSGFLLLSIFWLAEVVQREVFTVYNDFTILTLSILILLLTVGGLFQIKSKDLVYSPEPLNTVDIDEENIRILKRRMELEKDYLDPTLTLKQFALNCKLPRRTISEHLNKGLGKTFHDFVNEYRVEEVKRKLSQGSKENFTLESIAYDSGFNSKATFNRIFKKYTGLTPSKWTST